MEKTKSVTKKKKKTDKYAVIRIKGQQYKVSEGDEILIGKTSDKKIEAEVLLYSDGKEIKVGKPVVSGIKVKLKVLEEAEKGKKLHVKKYRAKSRYRKKIGFRPVYTRLLIEKIA